MQRFKSRRKGSGQLAATFRETEDEKIIKGKDYVIKTLGKRWNPNLGQFGFTVKLDKGTRLLIGKSSRSLTFI